ncbi:MAG: LacI family DNA-binding transcriptional regulator [Verrucomicrobiae bacterium]|nr:LacI family DNA-binding transcriptional regulator [Verrucomicrobiae bacterium]
MIRIVDIARKANVSPTTVSMVLNYPAEYIPVGEETSQKVLRVAQQLGYCRNDIARAMVTGKSRMVGFVMPSLQEEYVSLILEGILGGAESSGFFVKVLRAPPPKEIHKTIQQWIQMRPSGFICTNLEKSVMDEIHALLARCQIPLVTVDNSFIQPNGTYVISDDVQGIHQAIEHLAALGHSRIGFISGSPQEAWAIRRAEAYQKAMSKLNLSVPEGYLQCIKGKWRDGIDAVVRSLLMRSDRPTAMACAGDWMAMAVIRTAWHLDLHVPRSLSVVGYGNLLFSELTAPPLTTIAQPFAEMGLNAMQHLTQQIEQKKSSALESPLIQHFPTRLVVRESTGPVAKSISHATEF